MLEDIRRPAWAEIDLGAIAHNMREIRRITSPTAEIMAVLKADGYGHGAVQVAQVVLKNGATRLGVATLGEALKLRAEGIEAPILILGYTPEEQVETAIDSEFILTVFSARMAGFISRTAMKKGCLAAIHLKIDTGMGADRFLPGPDALREIKEIAAMPALRLEGIFTHFAVADQQDKSFSREQWARFTCLLDELVAAGIRFPIRHAANSAAIIDLPETHLDMVRAGIIIYGLYPSREVAREKIDLRPAMALKAQVAYVKKLPPGASVSYGRRFVAPAEVVIASLPLGYADGFPRALSNQAEVLIHGQRVRVAGTVCMDQFMVDASAIPAVQTGDEAVIFGRQGDAAITVEEVAERLQTINYEVVCMISERIPAAISGRSDQPAGIWFCRKIKCLILRSQTDAVWLSCSFRKYMLRGRRNQGFHRLPKAWCKPNFPCTLRAMGWVVPVNLRSH